MVSKFQSTLSVRRATFAQIPVSGGDVISIHALRKESDVVARRFYRRYDISIHALRKESDPIGIRCATPCMISIHALRKESDFAVLWLSVVLCEFQSTLSVRRATLCNRRGESHHAISIHALRKESDLPLNGRAVIRL